MNAFEKLNFVNNKQTSSHDPNNKNLQPLSQLAEAVYQKAQRLADLEVKSTIAIACSGGADSLALLFVLNELKPYLGFNLEVLHFNHGWRIEAQAEAEFVCEIADSLNLPFYYAETKNSALNACTEAAAREARFEFFESYLADKQAQGIERETIGIALAHHLYDQSETIMLNMSRGAGLVGLGGIKRWSGPYFRPFLEFEPDYLKAYLKKSHQAWIEDTSNLDTKYKRNFLRRIIMPELQNNLNAAVHNHLSDLALDCQEIVAFLDASARPYLHLQYQGILGKDIYYLRSSELINLAPPVRKNCWQKLYKYSHHTGKDLNRSQILQMENLSQNLSQEVKYLDLDGNYCFKIDANTAMILHRNDLELLNSPDNWQSDLDFYLNQGTLGGELFLDNRFTEYAALLKSSSDQTLNLDMVIKNSQLLHKLGLKLVENKLNFIYNYKIWQIPYDNLELLQLRTRRIGDFVTLDNGQHRSLKKLMVDMAIPAHLRDHILLIAQGHEIVWPRLQRIRR